MDLTASLSTNEPSMTPPFMTVMPVREASFTNLLKAEREPEMSSSDMKNHKLLPLRTRPAGDHESLIEEEASEVMARRINVFFMTVAVVPSGREPRRWFIWETVIFSEGTEKIIWDVSRRDWTAFTRSRLPDGDVEWPFPPP